MWNKQTKKTETQCFVETFRSTIISRLWNGIGWKYKNKRALKMPHCSGHWFIGKGTEPIQKQAPVQKHRPRLVHGRGHWGWPSLHHSFELSNQTQSRLEEHFRTSFYRYAVWFFTIPTPLYVYLVLPARGLYTGLNRFWMVEDKSFINTTHEAPSGMLHKSLAAGCNGTTRNELNQGEIREAKA